MKVLIIEDDKDIASLIEEKLSKEKFCVKLLEDLALLKEEIEFGDYDVVLLDIMLGKENGLRICKEIRSLKKDIIIVFISAISDFEIKEKGFEDCYADDYIVKPFSIDELLLRLRAIARRRLGSFSNIFEIKKDLKYDISKKCLIINGKEIELSKKLACLLEVLIFNGGALVSYEKLMNSCWDLAETPTYEAIRTHIKTIRKLLGEEFKDVIKNVSGIGYKLDI